MTGKEYADIIDGFDVEHNSKYLPSGGKTYCNIFAQDVADACDTPLPTFKSDCNSKLALAICTAGIVLFGVCSCIFDWISAAAN